MEDTIPKAAERLAKGHIADDVKCGEIYEDSQPVVDAQRAGDLLNQSHIFADFPVAANGFIFSIRRST